MRGDLLTGASVRMDAGTAVRHVDTSVSWIVAKLSVSGVTAVSSSHLLGVRKPAATCRGRGKVNRHDWVGFVEGGRFRRCGKSSLQERNRKRRENFQNKLTEKVFKKSSTPAVSMHNGPQGDRVATVTRCASSTQSSQLRFQF